MKFRQTETVATAAAKASMSAATAYRIQSAVSPVSHPAEARVLG